MTSNNNLSQKNTSLKVLQKVIIFFSLITVLSQLTGIYANKIQASNYLISATNKEILNKENKGTNTGKTEICNIVKPLDLNTIPHSQSFSFSLTSLVKQFSPKPANATITNNIHISNSIKEYFANMGRIYGSCAGYQAGNTDLSQELI